MESENITFFQVLRIKDVQLWEVKNGELFMRDRGFLSVLYSQLLDFFVLRVHDQKWALDKSLNIIGTQSVLGTSNIKDVETKLPTYLIPSFGGFYMIKIHDPNQYAVITNFETILQKTANFTRRSGFEKKLASFPLGGHRPENSVEKAVEKVKEGVLDAVGAIAKALTSADIDTHANQRIPRSYDELLQLDSTSSPVVDMSKTEIQHLKSEGEEITRNHLNIGPWSEFMQGDGPSTLSVDLLNLGQGPNIARKQSFNRTGEEDTGNIEKKEDPTGRDNQDLVGAENQRLPAYECHTTKEQVEEGLAQASANLEYGTEELPPHMQESLEFGVGLMYGPELTDHELNEIYSGSRSNLDSYSKTNLDAPSTTQPQDSANIDLLTGDTNAAGKSEDVSTKPSGGLGEVSNKQALGSQTSEKQAAASKPVDKENVGGTVTV